MINDDSLHPAHVDISTFCSNGFPALDDIYAYRARDRSIARAICQVDAGFGVRLKSLDETSARVYNPSRCQICASARGLIFCQEAEMTEANLPSENDQAQVTNLSQVNVETRQCCWAGADAPKFGAGY